MRPLQGRNTDVVVIYFLSPLINVIKGAPFTLKATTYEIPFLSFCTGCFRFLTLIKKRQSPALNQMKLYAHFGLVKCCVQATKINGR
jgi:hypothetical protein